MNNPFELINDRLSNIENLLLDMKHSPKELTKSSNEDVWFDLLELCNYLPDKPKRPTVYTWISLGTIPFHKGKKKLRFLKSEIDQWLKMGKVKSNESISHENDLFLTKLKNKKNG